MCSQVFIRLFESFNVNLGQDKRMAGIDMTNVHDRLDVLILVNNMGGNFSRHDPAKYAIHPLLPFSSPCPGNSSTQVIRDHPTVAFRLHFTSCFKLIIVAQTVREVLRNLNASRLPGAFHSRG